MFKDVIASKDDKINTLNKIKMENEQLFKEKLSTLQKVLKTISNIYTYEYFYLLYIFYLYFINALSIMIYTLIGV